MDEASKVQVAKVGTDKFKYVSAASGLIHELGHARIFSYNGLRGKHGEKIEMQIINGIEKQWSNAVGEYLRINHGGTAKENQKLFWHSKKRY